MKHKHGWRLWCLINVDTYRRLWNQKSADEICQELFPHSATKANSFQKWSNQRCQKIKWVKRWVADRGRQDWSSTHWQSADSLAGLHCCCLLLYKWRICNSDLNFYFSAFPQSTWPRVLSAVPLLASTSNVCFCHTGFKYIFSHSNFFPFSKDWFQKSTSHILMGRGELSEILSEPWLIWYVAWINVVCIQSLSGQSIAHKMWKTKEIF